MHASELCNTAVFFFSREDFFSVWQAEEARRKAKAEEARKAYEYSEECFHRQ